MLQKCENCCWMQWLMVGFENTDKVKKAVIADQEEIPFNDNSFQVIPHQYYKHNITT